MTAKREQRVKPIPLDQVTVSHNPRRPLRKLQDMGCEPLALVHTLALSEDATKRAEFVALIQAHQPEIVKLAETYATMQIQPVMLRDFRVEVNGAYLTRYGIVCGERRYIAWAYLQAVTGQKQTVWAIVKKLTVQEAYWLGVEENLQREDMTEVEKGQIFARYAEEHKMELTKVAEHFHVPYYLVRGRVALATKLPAERLRLYEEGKLNLTDAIREALGEQDATRSHGRKSRQVLLTVREIRAAFDSTPRSNVERLNALAEVMRLTVVQAVHESDERMKRAEEADARKVEKEVKSSHHSGVSSLKRPEEFFTNPQPSTMIQEAAEKIAEEDEPFCQAGVHTQDSDAVPNSPLS